MVMRGGTSKGVYFLADDLPADVAERDAFLLAVMGTPDARQIDGIGGAHPLTSKVAIVSASADSNADVDYLFLQLGVEEPTVSDRQNCGNLLAGVAPFAVERGLVTIDPTVETATVRVRMLNTNSVATAHISVVDGQPVYEGDTAISGSPGTAAAIRLDFDDIAGSSTGALLPTDNIVDSFCGIDTTLVDNGMPVVLLRATDLGISGYEDPADLEANDSLRELLEMIRLKAGAAMNLGDVADTTVPKMTIVSAPRDGGAFNTRTFIPHRCHQAIGVLGAVAAATGVMIPGAVGHELLSLDAGADTAPVDTALDDTVLVEHPTGSFGAAVAVEMIDGTPSVTRAGIVRTARKIMDGTLYPRSY